MSRNLVLDEVKKILAVAQKEGHQVYLIFKLMAGYGLRLGEVVGTDPRRWDYATRKSVRRESSLKGLQVEELNGDEIVVHQSGGRSQKRALLPELTNELREHIGKRTRGRIFELSVSRVEQLAREYAKESGLADWKEIHPHMFHDFYERHEGVLPDLLEAKLERPTTSVEIDSHEAAQAALLELGNILGFDTYTSDPSKDPGRQFYEVVDAEGYGGYSGVIPRNLGQIATLETIPDFAPERVLESARDIDVIWFKEDLPVVCFEVEHTTNVKQGLLRQFQISKHVPNARFFVIAPEEQRAKFEKEVGTYPFRQIRNRYTFKTYPEFIEFYDWAWKFHEAKSKFQLHL
ncbi:hypothetical protein AUH73_06820 [archaeon 13_1_40CM_4_53_4]|nr:MAG: hypothetical protein AUI07_09450 [archaeon 13_2_20CM_2_53_6]OLC61637.1 MAG: hypothetical protein AUH73_06820 [archaeon 13_1_40CM_4_53_4]